MTFLPEQLFPIELAGGIVEGGLGGIEVAHHELGFAAQQPCIVQEGIEFRMFHPFAVFLRRIVGPGFGRRTHTLGLHADFALVDGTLEIGFRTGFHTYIFIDGMQVDAFGILVILLRLHGCEAFLIGFLAVEIGIEPGGESPHVAVQRRVGLAAGKHQRRSRHQNNGGSRYSATAYQMQHAAHGQIDSHHQGYDAGAGWHIQRDGKQQSAHAACETEHTRQHDHTAVFAAEQRRHHLRQGQYGEEQHNADHPDGKDDGNGCERIHHIVNQGGMEPLYLGKRSVEGHIENGPLADNLEEKEKGREDAHCPEIGRSDGQDVAEKVFRERRSVARREEDEDNAQGHTERPADRDGGILANVAA